MKAEHKPLALLVLDGWGYSESTAYNAIHAADTPVWDRLWNSCPRTLLNASGGHVGLPARQMGNSEVGHMNIGSGRPVYQDLTRINKSMQDGSFFHNQVLRDALAGAARRGRAVHIMGLLSPGGVHGHQDHIFALLDAAARHDVRDIYLHAFLDGRDTPPCSAAGYLADAQAKLSDLGRGRIASLAGRYFAMDRNRNWARTQHAYNVIVHAMAEYQFDEPRAALEAAYTRGETDEFVKPSSIVGADGAPAGLESGDVLIFANCRADRARQLSEALGAADFTGFKRGKPPAPGAFITMTEYRSDFGFPVLFPTVQLENVLGEYLANAGMKQLRIAETEKYAHVTFFFNGGEEQIFKGEDRILVPSPDVATYDLCPPMSAEKVTEHILKAISAGKYDVIISNFANPDMVGHTGNFDAAVSAIETVDACIGKIADCVRRAGGELLVTADHGNAEQMRAVVDGKVTGQAHTAHTENPVPLVYLGRPARTLSRQDAALSDVAPTMLHIMGMEQPKEMTGRVLFELC